MAMIANTPSDMTYHTLLLGKIRVTGNTSLTLYIFPLIQAPLYLQYFLTDPTKILLEAVTQHGTPYSPWGFPDTLVVAGIYGLVVVSSRSSYGHIGGASVACGSPHSYVVWG